MTPVIFEPSERRRHRPAIRVLILVTDPVMRGLCTDLIGEAGGVSIVVDTDREGLTRNCSQIRPDVIIIGECGDDDAADDLLVEVMRIRPVSRVLVIGDTQSVRRVRSVQASGALGYLTWMSVPIALVQGIRSVARGVPFIGPDIGKRSFGPDPDDEPECLTDQEVDVLRHLAAGLPVRLVAMELGLPIKLVSRCQTSLRRKLRAETTIQAVQAAVRLGYLSPVPDLMSVHAIAADAPPGGGAAVRIFGTGHIDRKPAEEDSHPTTSGHPG